MRSLLKILLGGFLVFMVLAIADEWTFFSAAWFGQAAPAPELTEDERAAAEDSLRLLLSVMGHFYRSGGDSRFAERMPAAAWVVEEMQADVDYLRRNRRVQDPQLERMEVVSLESLSEDSIEMRTRELWRFEILWVTGGEAEPARVQWVQGRYLLARRPRGWRVEGWEILEPEVAREGGS